MPDSAWQRARDLVLRHGWNAVAYQVLNPGMTLWFAHDRDAVAGYTVYGRYRIVAGAPVCDPERLPAVAAELEREANALGERVLFFGAGTRLEQVHARDPGHRLLHLGALPVWDPAAWDGIVAHKASLRAQLHRAANKGIRVEEWLPARVRKAPALRAVLDAWLATRGLPPLGFLVTPDLLDHVDDRRTFVASRDGAVLAFLIATPVPARQGWLVEQWPRMPDAPNGTTHLLVDAAMRAFHASGSRYATLGLAPLALRAGGTHAHEAAWLRGVLHWVRAHGRRFYNFRGLEAFKAGMQPTRWEPVFAIAQGTRFTPGMLHAVAGAFSNGTPEWLVARALARAMRDEARLLLRRPAASSPRSQR